MKIIQYRLIYAALLGFCIWMLNAQALDKAENTNSWAESGIYSNTQKSCKNSSAM